MTFLNSLLSSVLLTGASIKYNKPLHELSEHELYTLREYLLSIGWDADYHLARITREVLDYYPNGKPYVKLLSLNNWQITFKLADRALNRYDDHVSYNGFHI